MGGPSVPKIKAPLRAMSQRGLAVR